MKLPRIRFGLLSLLIAIAMVAVAVRFAIAWIDASKEQQRSFDALRIGLDKPAILAVVFDHEQPGFPNSARRRTWNDHLFHRITAINLAESASDQTVQHLCDIKSLQRLYLSNCYFTSEARKRFASLDRVHILCLLQTDVDDGDIAVLAGMDSLRQLYLGQPMLTSDGLERLEKLSQLRVLALALDWEYFGGIEQNRMRLQAALPSCRILLFEPNDREFYRRSANAYRGVNQLETDETE